MNIKELKKVIAEALNDNDIKLVIDAINSEMERSGFQNMGVDVDEGAFEPSVTIFTRWFDEFSEKQADLINDKFNVFKTTEYLNGAEVYTESAVNTLIDVDKETKSEGSISFTVVISPDIEITSEFADEIADKYVQQMNNFWDEVYAPEMLDESLNENLSKDAQKLIDLVNNKISNSEYRTSTIKGVKNLSRSDLEEIVMYAEQIRDYGSINSGYMKPRGGVAQVLQKVGLIECINESINKGKSIKKSLKEDIEDRGIWQNFEWNIAKCLINNGITEKIESYLSSNGEKIVDEILKEEFNIDENRDKLVELWFNCPVYDFSDDEELFDLMKKVIIKSLPRCLTIGDKVFELDKNK